MPKLYTARVLADSLHPSITGIHASKEGPSHSTRLITIEVTFPRFILAEVNTHRMLSRNSASSRAIPTEDLIKLVKEEPFVPMKFNKRVKGMGVGEELAAEATQTSRKAWLWVRDQAVKGAEILLEQKVDKSRANRLLEPFMQHTAIITATDWDNFFALRDHKDAQPEFRLTAQVMLKAMLESTPRQLEHNDWHMPLVSPDEPDQAQMDYGPHRFLEEIGGEEVPAYMEFYWPMVSASRCARVSYDTHENFETVAKSMERAEMLVTRGHLSPLEHVARPASPEDDDWNSIQSNIFGWAQLRKLIPFEWNRVGHLEDRMSWEEMEIPEIPELEEMAAA